MDIQVHHEIDGKRFNKFGEELTECRLCDRLTSMLGTKLCDACYELEHRIHGNPDLARKILGLCVDTRAIKDYYAARVLPTIITLHPDWACESQCAEAESYASIMLTKRSE